MAHGPASAPVMAQLPLSYVSPLDEASSGALDGLRRMVGVKVKLLDMDGQTRPSPPSAALNDCVSDMMKHLHDVCLNPHMPLCYSSKGGLLKDIETLTDIRVDLVQCRLSGVVKELDVLLTSLILDLTNYVPFLILKE